MNYYLIYNGKIIGITEGNIVYEGKFRIVDDEYQYIVHKGRRGNSVMYNK